MNARKLLEKSLLAVVPLLFASVATADDYKEYHASNCYPSGSPPFTTGYSIGGGILTNTAGSTQTFLCPMVRDQWGAANGPDAAFRVFDNSTSRETCCTLRGHHIDGPYTLLTTCSGVPFNGGWTDLYIPPVIGGSPDGAYSGSCGIAAGASMSYYWVGERPQNE